MQTGTDWYEHRDELEVGWVFRCRDGSVVKLENRVEGDGTKWSVADWCWKSWTYDEGTIEPGDLIERLSDDYAGEGR